RGRSGKGESFCYRSGGGRFSDGGAVCFFEYPGEAKRRNWQVKRGEAPFGWAWADGLLSAGRAVFRHYGFCTVPDGPVKRRGKRRNGAIIVCGRRRYRPRGSRG